MHPSSVLAWVVAATLLLSKYVVVTTIQAARRLRGKRFRWREDAAHWGGSAEDAEDETVERCQAVLRNDSETQPFFLAFSAAWVALGAEPRVAFPVLSTYALARAVHATLLVVPRQPWRNRAFVLAQLTLVGIVADVVRRALG